MDHLPHLDCPPTWQGYRCLSQGVSECSEPEEGPVDCTILWWDTVSSCSTIPYRGTTLPIEYQLPAIRQDYLITQSCPPRSLPPTSLPPFYRTFLSSPSQDAGQTQRVKKYVLVPTGTPLPLCALCWDRPLPSSSKWLTASPLLSHRTKGLQRERVLQVHHSYPF